MKLNICQITLLNQRNTLSTHTLLNDLIQKVKLIEQEKYSDMKKVITKQFQKLCTE